MAAFAAAIEGVAKCAGLSRLELAAAWQLVLSRRFGCEEGRFMLPFGDLLNHSFEPSCAWRKPEKGGPSTWQLRTLRPLRVGEPINFEYCKDPNHLLLSTSGFIVPGNPYNRIMVKPADLRRGLAAACAEGGAGAAAAAEFAAWRAEEIGRQLADPEEDGPGLSMMMVARTKDGVQWNPLWLDLCGLATTSDPRGPHWSQSPGGVEGYCDTLERASWRLFETGLDEDAEALLSRGLTPNAELALRFRLGQKELLMEAVELLREQMLSRTVAVPAPR